MLKKIALVLLLGLCLPCGAFAAQSKNPVVVIETTLGKVKVELFAKEAPISVKNFLDYAKSGFYNGTIFHRVIPGFMIQGGGFAKDLTRKEPQAPIKNEADNGLKNVRGAISMARTPVVDSATSQFFICVADRPDLDHVNKSPAGFGYAVFGKVLSGMEVVDAIVNTPRKDVNTMIQNFPMVFQNVPVTPVVIKSVKVLQ